jgi:mono/diheme cytochrome c family protein
MERGAALNTPRRLLAAPMAAGGRPSYHGHMSRRLSHTVVVLLVALCLTAIAVRPQAQGSAANPSGQGGWTLPPNAESEKSPLPMNEAVIAAGKKLFAGKCQRCHGPLGKGDGDDAEAKYKKDMNLTVADRAVKNPDGVVFYKIWNGRTAPKMPRFGNDLSREQVWALVAYVQTLRTK